MRRRFFIKYDPSQGDEYQYLVSEYGVRETKEGAVIVVRDALEVYFQRAATRDFDEWQILLPWGETLQVFRNGGWVLYPATDADVQRARELARQRP